MDDLFQDEANEAPLSHEARWYLLAFQILGACGLIVGLASGGLVSIIGISTGLFILVAMIILSILVGKKSTEHMAQQGKLAVRAQESQAQVEMLFAMTEMMQSADGNDDAGSVLTATAQRLLPGFCGALYVFNNSRDRLDLVNSWNECEGFSVGESLLPNNCWALKRGKPHINNPAARGVCCMHHIGTTTTMEVPMMARGTIHGLLVLGTDSVDGEAKLNKIRRISAALADSMSLALSNIALREKLRVQSLRDPLTGLYNRRYMEDALERYVSLTERTGSPTSVVMIDLDDFKKLNDAHGHAKGDAVLREVAGQLLGAVRPSDVVARYGGEELLVILPDCPLKDAEGKAENMRQRIESLSEIHNTPITASFGVATMPENSTNPDDILPLADGALYDAKKAGKNCVRTAPLSRRKSDPQPEIDSVTPVEIDKAA